MRIVPVEIPTPFPVGPVNAYVVDDEPLTLVDAGPKVPEARERIAAALRSIGRQVRDVRRIVLTHGHADHFGSAAALAAESGAPVYVHPADRAKVRGLRWDEAMLRRWLREAGLPEAFAGTFLAMMEEYARFYDPIADVETLDDGQVLEFESGSLVVIHAPGHSAGHVVLWDGAGSLVAGDVLLEEVTPNPVVEFTSDGARAPTLPAYLHTLRRLQNLPVATAYPGHGAPISEPASRIAAILDHHEQRKTAIAALLDARPRTLVELAQEIYGELDPVNVVLALSEVIGHLDLLAEEGRLRVGRRDRAATFILA